MFSITYSLAIPIARAITSAGAGWLLAFGGVVVLGALLRSVAHAARSLIAQYAGLSAYVVLQAVMFVPLLMLADANAPGAIRGAAAVTALGFVGLTVVAFSTRRDFSFLGAGVRWGLMLGLLAIVAAWVFGFSLGTCFALAMVGLACAAVLFDTSNVVHHFSEDSYVAASLELFASIALMFWYLLRIFIWSRA